MTKKEAEQAIRHLCHEWARDQGIRIPPNGDVNFHPSFSAFKQWCEDKHYGHYFRFRSRTDPDSVAEIWFDQEFKQTWHN
jgi:hypothetical protein